MKPETYTPGHTPNAVQLMTRRSLESHGRFVMPLFSPGQKILDCGCGPGAISAGIAKRVHPGEVIGIDVGGSQLEEAWNWASRENPNASFQEASVYDLPFADQSFDGVFSHALFEHLREPLRALAEIRRVLKPGGFVALRSPDWGGFVLHPWHKEIEGAIDDYKSLQTCNGGDVYAGRKLASHLSTAGFAEVAPSASYEIYPSAGMIADYLGLQLERSGNPLAADRLRDWSGHPEAQFAQAWFEATGRKPR